MMNLLIVDDEEYILAGYIKGIDWSAIGVTNAFGAGNVIEAKNYVEKNNIQIIICDIEMPGQNGLEFSGWIMSNYPDIKIIFLSGHSNFFYAQKALQLKSFDYLLKPASVELLLNTVSKAISTIIADQEKAGFYAKSSKYYLLWEKEKPILIKRFWDDIINRRNYHTSDIINEFFFQYEVSLNSESNIVLVLFSVENSDLASSINKMDIYNITLQSIIEEIALKSNDGCVVTDYYGNAILILYSPDKLSRDHICSLAEAIVDKCISTFFSPASCYIDNNVSVTNASDSYDTLLNARNNNILLSNSVIFIEEFKQITSPKKFYTLNTNECIELFEIGKKDLLLSKLKSYLDLLASGNASKENLEAYFYSIINIVFSSLHKYGLSVSEAIENDELLNVQLKSLTFQQAMSWSELIIQKAHNYLQNFSMKDPSVIQKIKEYINERLGEDLTREDISKQIYMHPNYLSKLFKSETGQTLTEYITAARIDKAKYLLVNTNNKISSIGDEVGIINSGYFTKLFRSSSGLTPQEYRKKYQISN